MTWFKVDDGWWSHPKVIPVESDARGIWVSAGSWCAQHLTDGFLPEYALKMITELRGNKLKAACEELIEAGLWKRRPGGFLFHDWEKYQPIREDVEKKRAADRERKAASRVRAETERKPRRFGKESNSPVPSRPVHTPIPPPFRDVVRELDERVRADDAAANDHQAAKNLLDEAVMHIRPLTPEESQNLDDAISFLAPRKGMDD
jgi:hypothetical protein